jgi:hypothetical protein
VRVADSFTESNCLPASIRLAAERRLDWRIGHYVALAPAPPRSSHPDPLSVLSFAGRSPPLWPANDRTEGGVAAGRTGGPLPGD